MRTHNPSGTSAFSGAESPEQWDRIIPAPAAAAGAYHQFTVIDDLVFTAGQIAIRDGALVATGLVGRDVDIESARECARACLLNVLAQIRSAAGGLDKVDTFVKLTIFVASDPGFTSQHVVADAASQLLTELMGPAGRHSRSAVGVAALPLGSPVEIEAIARIGGAV
ncbi:RidA family protein [Nocardia sp. NPDC059240]|uniref:RidA family protein n=1 Tax=Nocardia sp. NPDC059240 TaxID=3346786 RepID=UPI0036B31F82